MSFSHEYQFLCGILAQQLGLATGADVAEALRHWRAHESMSLIEILQRNGVIDQAGCKAIEQAVERQLFQHDGDVHLSLAAIRPSPSLYDSVSGIDQGIDSVVSWLASLASPNPEQDEGRRNPDDSVDSPAEPGRYEIKSVHARGGLGEVFVARDRQLDRDVALKQILPAFASDNACRQRFVLEARVTGSLEHPGIVPVYGLGVQPDGRPFYVMRFIRGETLEAAVVRLHRAPTNQHLELRKLLQRFISVCHAMHYAHSRGILHRDLKPSNIMLGPYGETLIVDWGLARVMEDPAKQSDRLVDEQTLHPATAGDSESTRWGTLIGTLAFMSPEQALGWHDALTPASDVYSLGATLYTMLTGQPAFTGTSLEQVVLSVQRGEFARPRTLVRTIAKPLEAICLKAMATTPHDRYHSALELANDLERYLADEPITARREPWWTRSGRWMRRHRGTTGAILTGLLALFVGLALLTVALSFIGQRERSLRLAAEKEGQRADSNFQLAHGAIDRYLTEITDDPLLKQQGFEGLRRQLLENARDFYQQLLSRRAADSALAVEQAWTHFRLGSIEQQIGTSTAAQNHFLKARDAFQRLADRGSSSESAREGLAMACINLANLYYKQGKTDVARQQLAVARKLTGALLKDRVLPNLQRQLATCLNNEASWALAQDDKEVALESYQHALTIRTQVYQQRPDNIDNISELVALYGNLTVFHRRFGEMKKAQQTAERAVAIGQKELAARTERPYALHALAVAQIRLADLHAETNRHQQARATYLSAKALLTQLVDRHRNVHVFRKDLALCENNLGNLNRSTNHLDEALTNFQRAVAVCEQLVQSDPGDIQYADLLGSCLLNEATLQLDLGQLSKAGPLIDRALAIYVELANSDEAAPKKHANLARLLVLQGQLLAGTNQTQAAITSYNRATKVLQTLADQYPEVPFYRSYLATALERLGVLSMRAGISDRAESYLQQAIQLRRDVANQVGDARTSVELATAQVQLSRVWTRLGKTEQAEQLLNQAIDLMQQLASGSSSNADAKQRLTAALLQRGLLQMQQQQYEPALADFERLAEMSLGKDRIGVLCQRALCLARLHRHMESAMQIENVQSDLGNDAFALYDAAATYALCVELAKHDPTLSVDQREKTATRYLAAAIRLLERLRDTGYLSGPDNQKAFAADAQFTPLHAAKSYQAFLKTLSGHPKSGQ